MTDRRLLDQAISLLCGSTSGFVFGSRLDCEWQNNKDKLFKEYRETVAVRRDGEQQDQKP